MTLFFHRFYPAKIIVFFLSFSLLSCGDEVDPGSELSPAQEEAIDYFKDIALGFEFGTASRITRKWTGDVRVAVNGSPTPELLAELDLIMADLNALISTINIQMAEDPSQSNFQVFFGTGQEFEAFAPFAQGFTDSNFGLFFVSFSGADVLGQATIYVDTERPTPLKQRHLLREEFTQSLGLAQDSPLYQDSMFQSAYNLGC
ncbi:MAG: DUF2927 domain-containing protein, partial [Bacteroidota bacterium]